MAELDGLPQWSACPEGKESGQRTEENLTDDERVQGAEKWTSAEDDRASGALQKLQMTDRTPLESLSVAVANGPVMAGNQLNISVDNCQNPKIAAVVFEKHIHLGSRSSSVQDDDGKDWGEPPRGSREIFADLVRHYVDRYSRMSAWEGGPPYATEDLYIGLKMYPLDRSGQLRQGDAAKKRILFEPFSRTGVAPRTVLVRGDTGFGKTTLCRKIAYDWAGQGKTSPFFRTERTVVLYLDAAGLPQDAVLEDELLGLAVQKSKPGPEELEDARQTLSALGRDVIVVLDGYVGLGDGIRAQIDRMVGSESERTLFGEASVLVVSRTDVDDRTLHRFQKNFVLRGFTWPMTQRLVTKFFKHSPDPRGGACLQFLNSLQLKGLSPSAILALCRCGARGRDEDGILRLWLFRILHPADESRSAERLHLLGAFFWNCFRKKKCEFTRREMEMELGNECHFFLDSGLLRTSGPGAGTGRLVWEPLHRALMDAVVVFHLEKRWRLCVTADDVGHFLGSLFPRLPYLRVKCSLDSHKDELYFDLNFDYDSFQMSLVVSDRVGSCTVRTRPSVGLDSLRDSAETLELSYVVTLRKKRDGDEVMSSLRSVFPKVEALDYLARFVSPSRFETVRLSFVSSLAEWTPNGATDGDVVHPLASLRRLARDFHLVFARRACTYDNVRCVVERVLELNPTCLKFRDSLDVIETLRKTPLSPPFEAAHVYGRKCVACSPEGRNGSEKLCDRIELFFQKGGDTELPF